MAKWLMYSKRADFTAMGKKYQIDPVVARMQPLLHFCIPAKKTLGMEKP